MKNIARTMYLERIKALKDTPDIKIITGIRRCGKSNLMQAYINYIKNNFEDIKKYASVIENRLDDSYCTLESTLEDNKNFLNMAQKHKVNYILVEDKYEINLDL